MEKTITILTLKNSVEAQLMKGILEEKRIPHIIHSFFDSAYDGIFQTKSAWGEIKALPEYAEEIIAIYRAINDNSK